MAAPAMLESLRPKPFRGDVIAAGVVVLVTLIWLLEARFGDDWATGVHLLYAAPAALFTAAIAVLAPMEREEPRAYQSVLYVASFALGLAALANLADALGADGIGGAGARTWTFALLAALSLWFATQRNSAVSTLLGALAAGLALLSFVQWAFDAHGAGTTRWVLLAEMVGFTIGALGQRDRHPRHGVALVDAAGVAVVLIGLTLVAEAFGAILVAGLTDGGDPASAAWGWQLLLLGAGFGLIAYSGVDRERGPAWLGLLSLAIFVLLAADGGFVGWPLVLLVVAAALLAVGLRPTLPAPPPPDADVPPAPAEPLWP
ncbi:MAG TPA: hypothetical protein VFT50_06950 [Baekduia sp.]|nr:hypothetical protein [Baekduia sp.]